MYYSLIDLLIYCAIHGLFKNCSLNKYTGKKWWNKLPTGTEPILKNQEKGGIETWLVLDFLDAPPLINFDLGRPLWKWTNTRFGLTYVQTRKKIRKNFPPKKYFQWKKKFLSKPPDLVLTHVWNPSKKISKLFFSLNFFSKKNLVLSLLCTDEPSCMSKMISITHKFKRCVTMLTSILV